MTKPPDQIVDMAIALANCSPCGKSKRGCLVYQRNGIAIPAGNGFNGPPANVYACDKSIACQQHCGAMCVHAEVRAIRDAIKRGFSLGGCDIVHVKTIGGVLVSSGGPSCVSCANQVLDCGLQGFWLYHVECMCQNVPAPSACPRHGDKNGAPGWRRYGAREFYDLTMASADLPAFAPRT